jgi:hypothetical protein
MGPSTPLDALLATPAWRDIPLSFTAAMTELFQLHFAAIDPRELPEGEPFVAEISLSEPSKHLEIVLSVVAQTESMKRLSAHLLGDDDLAGAQDLILESANIVMGTLKTSFAAHGFVFTGGIPGRASVDRSSVGHAITEISGGGCTIALWVRVKEKGNATIRGRALREGHVVDRDVRGPCGSLLVAGGSRLTRTSAEHLATLVPDIEVAVSDPTT